MGVNVENLVIQFYSILQEKQKTAACLLLYLFV